MKNLNELNWNTAPKWAKWHAVDMNGNGHWFKHEPKPQVTRWLVPDDVKTLNDNESMYSGNYGFMPFTWVLCLQERPKNP